MAERKPIQGRAREIAGVVLFALAVFLFLAVISYSPSDPSLSNYETSRAKISNIGGIIGSYLADLLIRFLGLSAYWLPLFLLITSVKLFLDAGFLFRPGWIGGFVGLIVTTSGLFAHAYKLIPLVDTPFAAGGFVGTLLSEYLNALFNPGGTFIFLLLGLIVSLIVTVDLSVVTALRKAYGVARSTGRGIRSYAEIGREKVTDYLKEDEVEEQKREAPTKAEKRPPPLIREEKAPAQERTRKKKVEQTAFEFAQPRGAYILPPLTLLDDVPRRDTKQRRENLIANARLLEKKLADFGVEGKVTEVKPGPVITMYELEPAPGVKINKIANLSDDLALALKAPSVRIVAPIPGKAAIGIEIPNPERDSVTLRDAVDNEAFAQSKNRLPIALGEDITGMAVIADLIRMPHLLIAGATGSGKSVCINSIIACLLLTHTPDSLRLLMVDPKMVELSTYNGIPHLLSPVVTEIDRAAGNHRDLRVHRGRHGRALPVAVDPPGAALEDAAQRNGQRSAQAGDGAPDAGGRRVLHRVVRVVGAAAPPGPAQRRILVGGRAVCPGGVRLDRSSNLANHRLRADAIGGPCGGGRGRAGRGAPRPAVYFGRAHSLDVLHTSAIRRGGRRRRSRSGRLHGRVVPQLPRAGERGSPHG